MTSSSFNTPQPILKAASTQKPSIAHLSSNFSAKILRFLNIDEFFGTERFAHFPKKSRKTVGYGTVRYGHGRRIYSDSLLYIEYEVGKTKKRAFNLNTNRGGLEKKRATK